MLLYIPRTTLEELKYRQLWQFTLWKNTAEDELWAHCVRIVSLKLCMDDITDAGYWKYMNATPFQKAQMQLKCFVMYPLVKYENRNWKNKNSRH